MKMNRLVSLIRMNSHSARTWTGAYGVCYVQRLIVFLSKMPKERVARKARMVERKDTSSVTNVHVPICDHASCVTKNAELALTSV